MKKIIEKYLEDKHKFSEEGSQEIYSFLNDLSRYAFCESLVLSSSDEIFNDFIEEEKRKALIAFDKFYGVIEDYNLDLYRIAKEGTFFSSVWKELDNLLLDLYWRSIKKGKPSRDQKDDLSDLLVSFLEKINTFEKYMNIILPKLILYLKKEAIIQAVLLFKKDGKKLDQRKVENFLAMKIEDVQELEKETKIFLGKDKGKKVFDKLVKKEEWYFNGKFEHVLKSLLTNNIINLPKVLAILNKLSDSLLQNKSNEERILGLIYSYRKEILCLLNEKEGKFYKNFIKEYKISFKHTGTYSISYLKKEIVLVENALRCLLKKEKMDEGYSLLSEIVYEIIIRIRNQFRKSKIGYVKKEVRRKNKQGKMETGFKYVQTKEFSLKVLHKLEEKISDNQLTPITNLNSLALCYRKCSAFIHLLAEEIELKEEEAKDIFSLFTIFFIDALFLDKNREVSNEW